MPAPILVADRDPVFADLLEAYLTRRGHAVARADDGRRALDTVRRQRLTAVVVSLELPGLDGLELAASAAAGASPPVVLLTRTPAASLRAKERMRQLSLRAVIERPCPLARIAAAIEGDPKKPGRSHSRSRAVRVEPRCTRQTATATTKARTPKAT